MIPVASQITHTDNLPGERVEFGIGDPKWTMFSQAHMYSNIEGAVVREYSTNGYDAHVEAGIDRPIEVTLPSAFQDKFIVRDFGEGMSYSVLKEVYTQFGISTKRKSNKTNGQQGAGCKSAVAYTPKFKVTSIHKGRKFVGIIQRDADWAIYMNLNDMGPTDEPSGTTVEVPVHNYQEFNAKAMDFYKYWLPGRVLINGKPNTHYVGEKIADNLYYSKQWNASFVVLANVPYRIENPAALFHDSKIAAMNFVAYVDHLSDENGAAVEFTPNREALIYSDRTKGILQNVIDKFEKDIVSKAKADIDGSSNHAEAWKNWNKWRTDLGAKIVGGLTFRGDVLETSVRIDGYRWKRHQRYGGPAVQRISEWEVENFPKSFVVTEFDIQASSAVKVKMNEYFTLNGLDPTYVIFTDAKTVNSKWVDQSENITWQAIKDALPKTAGVRTVRTSSGRVAGSFDLYDRNGMSKEVSLNTSEKGLLFTPLKGYRYFRVDHMLSTLDSDKRVILVPANRMNKFKRDFPDAVDFMTWAKAQVVIDSETLLSDDAKELLSYTNYVRKWVARLDASLLDDPMFAKAKSLVEREDELLKAYRRNANLANALRMVYNVKEYEADADDTEFRERYALLDNLNRYSMVHDHLYLYMNAAWAATKEKK